MIYVISKQTAEHDLNLAQYGKAIATAEMKQHTKLQAQFEASQVSYNRYKHGEFFPEILALTLTNEFALTLLQVDQNQASPMLLYPNHDCIKGIKL